MTKDFRYEGFSEPNYTPVPDDLFDVIAPELTESELRVLLYIIRRTFGFKRESDSISLSQMVDGITTKDGRVLDRGTGLSRRGVMAGCQGLVDKQIISVTKGLSPAGDNEINVYSLRFKGVGQQIPYLGPGVGQQVPYPRAANALGVGQQMPPQKTVNKTQVTRETGEPKKKELMTAELPPPEILSMDQIREMTPEERLAQVEATKATLKRLPRLS